VTIGCAILFGTRFVVPPSNTIEELLFDAFAAMSLSVIVAAFFACRRALRTLEVDETGIYQGYDHYAWRDLVSRKTLESGICILECKDGRRLGIDFSQREDGERLREWIDARLHEDSETPVLSTTTPAENPMVLRVGQGERRDD